MTVTFSCVNCKKYSSCVEPCKPVETYLEREEPKYLKEFPLSREILLVNQKDRPFFPPDSSDLNDDGELQRIPDSDEFKLGQFQFEPTTQRSRIFYERFFLGLPFAEIAKRHDLKEESVRSMYRHARKRVRQILEYLDGRDRGVRWHQGPKKDLSDAQKWWVLNRIFGYSFDEISDRFAGMHKATVIKAVNGLQRKWKSRYYQELAAVPA